jgi:hypothetical protein
MSGRQHDTRQTEENDGVTTHECNNCGRQGAYYPVTQQSVGPLAREGCDDDG